jgi:tetraacyldisaccharide 4'-kinase
MTPLLNKLQLKVEAAWYKKSPWVFLLLPLSWLYCGIVTLRKQLYKLGIFKRTKFNIPVIAVGNIVVGGAGKTPFTIKLANQLCDQGYRVGIVSRGYKAQAKTFPFDVSKTTDAKLCGDEALLMQQRTACPVVIDPKRTRGIQHLIDKYKVQIVICDDGLQHLALQADITIALHPHDKVGEYAFCLPAGPLREKLSELSNYNFIVDTADLKQTINIITPDKQYLSPEDIGNKQLLAITAIARPQRFAEALKEYNLRFASKYYPDHYYFKQDDFTDITDDIIMTEKDWVKCQHIKFNGKVYIAQLDVQASHTFQNDFAETLKRCLRQEAAS